MTLASLNCRLFGIGDELPLQYCLATVEEINEYPTALDTVSHIIGKKKRHIVLLREDVVPARFKRYFIN